jgi:hypothetical protein
MWFWVLLVLGGSFAISDGFGAKAGDAEICTYFHGATEAIGCNSGAAEIWLGVVMITIGLLVLYARSRLRPRNR